MNSVNVVRLTTRLMLDMQFSVWFAKFCDNDFGIFFTFETKNAINRRWNI